MRTDIKQAHLLKFIKELKDNGFKVYAPSKGVTTYCHFVKDDRIGYVESSDWGFNFGTVHKPCRECGTGYSIHRETYPTVRMAEDSLTLAPHWATSEQMQAIKKYKSWEDYVNFPQNKWSSQVEL